MSPSTQPRCLQEVQSEITYRDDTYRDNLFSFRLEQHLDSKRLRLLLVEDELSDSILAQELIKESMPDYQWEILTAPSIFDAISLLSTVRFDLALVDLGLRDTQGPQTVDILCMVAPYVPIVVYSGTESDTVLDESLRRGAYICLSKERTPPEIMRMALTTALSHEISKSS